MRSRSNVCGSQARRPLRFAASLLGGILAVSALSTVAFPQAAAAPTSPSEPTPPAAQSRPLRAWIQDVADNEIRAIQHTNSYVRYRIHSSDAKGDHVRDTIETKDGTVARLVLVDGKRLTDEQDKAERDRLNDMLSSPAAFSRHIHNDGQGKKLAIDLIRMMPDAMTYTWAPAQPQTQGAKPGSQLVIDYQPNPAWKPPSTTSEALTGLRGRMWIDPHSHALLRMEGEIFKPVNFGWGVLAHIYPGGQLLLEQTAIGSDRWIFTHFEEHIRVRAIMVKTMSVESRIDASAFQLLPSALSYQEAIRLLLNTPLPDR